MSTFPILPLLPDNLEPYLSHNNCVNIYKHSPNTSFSLILSFIYTNVLFHNLLGHTNKIYVSYVVSDL